MPFLLTSAPNVGTAALGCPSSEARQPLTLPRQPEVERYSCLHRCWTPVYKMRLEAPLLHGIDRGLRQLCRSTDGLNALNRTIAADLNLQYHRSLNLLLSSVFRILGFDAV